MANESDAMFVLVGFPGLPEMYNPAVSCVLFLVFLIAFSANGTVILLVNWKEHLHQPMYIILANLALSDILFDTVTLPKIIARYWFGAGNITFSACMFQLFCVHYLGTFDSFIIMFMALDRYVAIIHPLRYSSIITTRRTIIICVFLWLFSSVFSLINVIWNAQFPYCGSRRVNNCFCVNMAILGLACGDNSSLRLTAYYMGMTALSGPLCYIIITYILIFLKVRPLWRDMSGQKAFSTCITHLFIIAMYYGPREFVYAAYQLDYELSLDVSVLLLCLYTFVPHVLNPIIYCLRTQEIRQVIRRELGRKFGLNIETGGFNG